MNDRLQRQADELLNMTTKKAKPEKSVSIKKPTLKELKSTSKLGTIQTTLEGIVSGTDRAFGIMSTRLKNISLKLFQDVRNKYINPTRILIGERTLEAHPFIDGIVSKLNESDRVDFEIAQWQGNEDEVKRIVSAYSLTSEYEQYRSMLDLIYHEGNSVGMDIDYKTIYFPSAVKDFNGLLKELDSREEYAPVVIAMLKAEKSKNRPLSNDEKIQIIDSLLRGYKTTGITLSKPGFAKERTLLREDASLLKFYYGFEESTSRYIESMTENIQARKFFGKTTKELVDLRANISRLRTSISKQSAVKERTTEQQASLEKSQSILKERLTELELKDDKLLENSIGTYVLDLVESKTINYNQQVQLQQIFDGIFKTSSSNKFIHTLRSLEYAGSLAQIPALITQYSEVILSILKAPNTTLPNFIRANLGTSKIKLTDIAVAHIGQEWVDADLDKTITYLMKPFEKADSVGKETFVNSVIDKYRKLAETNPDEVKKELAKYYPVEAFDSIINSLKSGKIDNNIKGFALNELADVQPISKMEVPELYAKAGNLRVFYMYKTFVLKRLDIIRNQAYNEIRDGIKSGDNKRILKGLGHLVWLALMFSLADSSADAVKDLIRGKPIDKIENYVVDNLLQMMLLSKYSLSKVKTGGVDSLFKDNIALPISNLSAAFTDIWRLFDEDSEKGSELVRRIPWLGEMYYWYMGEGYRKIDEGVYDKE